MLRLSCAGSGIPGNPFLPYDEYMDFDAKRYHPEVAAVLAMDGNGQRPLPLIAKSCVSQHAKRQLGAATTATWFPGARAPQAAMAGLWLYFSCFTESHSIAQDLHSPEGAYWHGILHRQEPDNWNAKYWLRQAAKHPIHPALRAEAVEIAASLGDRVKIPAVWDSLWFADLHDAAAHDPSHPLRQEVTRIQLAEWQLLFDFCASVPDLRASAG